MVALSAGGDSKINKLDRSNVNRFMEVPPHSPVNTREYVLDCVTAGPSEETVGEARPCWSPLCPEQN